MTRRAVVIAGSVLGVTVVGVAIAFAAAVARDDTALPGVVIAGVDVGGLDAPGLRGEVERLADARGADQVTLTHEDRSFPLEPADIGARVDVDAVVERLLAAGREGDFFADRIRALRGVDVTLELDVVVDEELLRDAVAAIAAEVDRATDPGGAVVDPVTLQVASHPPVEGVRVLQEEAQELVRTAVAVPGDDEIALPVELTTPDTDASDVTRVAGALRDAIADDLVLTSEEGRVTLAPRELALLLSTAVAGEGVDASLVLVVEPSAVEEHLTPLVQPLLREPRDAAFSAPSVPSTTFDDKDDAVWRPVPADVELVPGRNGTELDPEVVGEQLTETVRAGEREVALRLTEVPPDFATDEAVETVPDTLLSTFTTYHACCQSRVENIQRLADLVDGTVVLPGEQFSVNQISGVRECSKGFVEAGMILNGEIVDSCGGGVSQFGTTTVNAVFFAGLSPDAYKPHSFYISRYPMGREATLNYPSPDIDVRFTNDTGHPILIRTAHTSTSITVSFYGRTDVARVEADLGSPKNIKPYRTIERVNSSLAPGARVKVQSGQNGFYVTLTRTVVRTDGDTESDDWSNTYVPETEIYEYNPARPAPKPSPSPSPSPSPEGD